VGQVTANQFWAGVAIVSAALVVAAVVWFYYHRRWFRVKAIILLATAFVLAPGFNVAAKVLDVRVEVPGPGWPAALVVFAAINWLGALEWRSRHSRPQKWSTYDALAIYIERLQTGAPKHERIQMLRSFSEDETLDDEIISLCHVAELIWPAQYQTVLTPQNATGRDSE